MARKPTLVWFVVCFAEVVVVFVVVASSAAQINAVESTSILGGTVSGTMDVSPASTAHTGSSYGNETLALPTRRCEPVPHDVLWQRLLISSVASYDSDGDEDDNESENFTSSSWIEGTGTEPTGDPLSKLNHHVGMFYAASPNQRSIDVVAGTPESSSIGTPLAELVPDSRPSADSHRRRRSNAANQSRRHHRRRHQHRSKRVHRRRQTRHDVEDPQEPSMAKEFRRSSWHCHLEKWWKRMPDGVFPSYIQTGSCRKQATCMLGLYECRPRRYRIKILRRIDSSTYGSATSNGYPPCRPLANVGVETLYEEAWHLVERKVVVGCECSRKRGIGGYYRPENG